MKRKIGDIDNFNQVLIVRRWIDDFISELEKQGIELPVITVALLQAVSDLHNTWKE